MWNEHIIEALIKRGVTYFIISPGSRSTPLTLAVARHPQARSVIAYDERAAAYHAVGYARATNRPAALICTSGTAAANYLPAVTEASNDALPLIAITADRPPELHNIGANQTINQQHLYGDFVRHFLNIPPEGDGLALSTVIHDVKKAINAALFPLPGPVHINCMFREPFDYLPCAEARANHAALQKHPPPSTCPDLTPPSVAPLSTYHSESGGYPATTALDLEALNHAVGLAANARHPMLIVGYLATDEARASATALAVALAWPTWVDLRSGLHQRVGLIADTCALDARLSGPKPIALPLADFVLHIGGNFLSRTLLDYLRDDFDGPYVKLSGDTRNLDPTGRCTLAVPGDIANACNALAQQSARLQKPESRIGMAAAYPRLREALEAVSNPETPLSEPSIGYLLSKHLSHAVGLVIGNSMPVRFCDRFAIHDQLPSHVAVNRGVSGIDGTIATAAGFRAGLERPVVCLLGDVSFMHDMNSLTQLSTSALPLIILVVNNHGGGIFHHLPIARHPDVFETFFVTPHAYSFSATAEQFGLPYARVETNGQFVASLQSALRSNTHALIELTVDQQANMQIYQRIASARQLTAPRHDGTGDHA